MSRAPGSPLVGRVLGGRYEVRAPLARGGMSEVFAGLDRTLGREVAIKVVSLTGGGSAELLSNARERFRREAGAAARIQHPSVVQVHDYGTDPELDLDFIVMELLRGRDLKALLREGPLERDAALRILVEAARGVAAGHRAGLVHRDVKPGNLFLPGDEPGGGGVKVLDFGIARAIEEEQDATLTRLGPPPHSPAYAAPEQFDVGVGPTPATDVYQLGLVAYEALGARRPFDDGERARIREGERVPLPETVAWSDTPPAVRAVVERALEREPGVRFPDAAAFADALEAAAGGDSPPEPAADAATLPAAGAAAPLPTAAHAARSVRPALRRLRGPAAWVVPLLLLLLLALAVHTTGRRGGDDAPLPATYETAGDAEPPPPLPPAPEPTPVEEIDAAVAVQRELTEAVHDLNRAWVDGEISRHVGHYASRVDYYNSRRLPRSGVRRDRTRDLNRYDDRRIGIHEVRVELLEEDRARVLVDKEWYFAGGGRTRQGRGLQEYVFRRDAGDGRWYVVSEQLLTTNERRSGADEG
jgi:hypothetical protein